MEISKKVTSRNGNNYKVDLTLEYRSIKCYSVYNSKGDKVLSGSGSHYENVKDREYLLKAIKDLILYVEDEFFNYEIVKELEDWNGIIN